MDEGSPRVVVAVIDGLPLDLLDRRLGDLEFLRERTPYRAEAVSCFPSTTGPAYFPLLAGVTPGRANVPGIRWFDRTRATRTRFPHRGLRSYVGPDAAKMQTDTAVTTLLARHAWPASSPVAKDSPKSRERSRDLLWATAHLFHTWSAADRRTAWKLGRGLRKGRPIVFAVFPSVDEYGHVFGASDVRPDDALVAIDGLLADTLADFDGEVLVTADHGLTDTSVHLDLRGLVEERVGPTLAFPLVAKPNPAAVVCESGNAMANVYLRVRESWREPPDAATCRELARDLAALEGIDSVAFRGEADGSVEIVAHDASGTVGIDDAGLYQRGALFARDFAGLGPAEALAASIDDERPDAAFALVSLCASERAGDLLVSASRGYDLRTVREWPEHHASHGAIHRAHTVVPVLSSAPLPGRPLRTLDLFTLTLELAGLSLEEYRDADAALLERGAWTPGVAR